MITSGLVTRLTRTGEADLIVDILQPDGHSQSAYARSARKLKSRSRAALELGNTISFSLAASRGTSLPYLREAKLLSQNSALKQQASLFAEAFILAEACQKLTLSPSATTILFSYLEELDHLEREHPELLAAGSASVALAQLLLLVLQDEGFLPELNSCVLTQAGFAGSEEDEQGISIVALQDEIGFALKDAAVVQQQRRFAFSAADSERYCKILNHWLRVPSAAAGLSLRWQTGDQQALLQVVLHWLELVIGKPLRARIGYGFADPTVQPSSLKLS